MSSESRFLLVLDSKFPQIGRKEIQTLSKAEKFPLQEVKRKNKKIWIKSNDKSGRKLNERGAYVNEVYKELGPLYSIRPTTLKKVFRNTFLSHKELPGTFKVTIREKFLHTKNKEKMIHEIANFITSTTGAEISLESPNSVFTPLRKNKEIHLLVKLPPSQKDFRTREPKYRPYSPSITMGAKLSRALVNLSHTIPSKSFLDPFCGSGSFLLEAASVNAKTIGCDLSRKDLAGARWNAKFYNLLSRIQTLEADATSLPFSDNSIWSIASDLPYGRASSLYGYEIETLYEEFLTEANRILLPRKFIAFCAAPPIQTIDLSRWSKKFHTTMELPRGGPRHILLLQNK